MIIPESGNIKQSKIMHIKIITNKSILNDDNIKYIIKSINNVKIIGFGLNKSIL